VLDQIGDYAPDHIPELRSVINVIKAVAKSLHDASKDNHDDSAVAQDVNKAVFRLPEIPIPRFNGKFHEWATFRDRFNVLVDSRSGLSDTDKVYYLISCLRGAAQWDDSNS
jgi:hypothetical protein